MIDFCDKDCEEHLDELHCREQLHGFTCTRLEDHEGVHIACGNIDCNIRVWK